MRAQSEGAALRQDKIIGSALPDDDTYSCSCRLCNRKQNERAGDLLSGTRLISPEDCGQREGIVIYSESILDSGNKGAENSVREDKGK